jgi:hypothetical protein
MNRFLKYWRLTGCGEAFRAHVIAYADDFVILSRGCAAEALAWTKAVMTRLGLTLSGPDPKGLQSRTGTDRLGGLPDRYVAEFYGGTAFAMQLRGRRPSI